MRSTPVKMDKKPPGKHHPPIKKKKMADLKQPVRDTVSETISFVIKGKLTPIKPIMIDNNIDLLRKPNKKMQKCGKVIKPRQCKTNQNRIVKQIRKTGKEKNKVQIKTATKSSTQSKKPTQKIVIVAPSKTPVKVKKCIKGEKQPKIEKIKAVTKIDKTLKVKNEKSKKAAVDKHKKTTKTEIENKKTEVNEGPKDNVAPKSKAVETKPKIGKVKKEAKASKQTSAKPPPSQQKPIQEKKKHLTNSSVKKSKVKKRHEPIIIKEEPSSPCGTPDSSSKEVPCSPTLPIKEIKKEPEEHSDSSVKTTKKKQCKKLKTKPKITVMKKRVMSKNRETDETRCKTKLFGFWNGPKRHRVASLNALAKVHCLYENEGKGNLLDLIEEQSRLEYEAKRESLRLAHLAKIKEEDQQQKGEEEDPEPEEEDDDEEEEEERSPSPVPTRTLRSVPGLRAVGKHWDMPESSSSSDESDTASEPKETKNTPSDQEEHNKQEPRNRKRRRRNRGELIMDLKDMVVRKRMASLNASAILAASYSSEKRQTKVVKTDYDSSSCESGSSEEYFANRNIKEEIDIKKEDDRKLIEVHTTPNKKVAVILNQDTDVTITGVYVNSTTRSTRHEGYCSIAGMQYHISATSHTHQTATAAAAVATETLLQSAVSGATDSSTSESPGCSKSYTPLDALSNMQPPPGPGVHHNHPVIHAGGGQQHLPPPPPTQHLTPPHHVLPMPTHQLSPSGLRHGCSSAFSSPHSTGSYGVPHQSEPGYVHGYYQPAGPLITVPHGHGQPPVQPPPPLAKSTPLSEPSPLSTTPSVTSHEPPPAPASTNGDSSDSEVIITSVTTAKESPSIQPVPHHPPYRYAASHHQYPPPPGYPYAYPPAYHHYPPPSPASYHELCYSPYKYATFGSSSSRRYLAAASGAQYYTGPPPSGGGHQDMYPPPAPLQSQTGQQSQQVATSSPSAVVASSYPTGSGGPPPPPALVDPYAGPPPQAALVEAYPPPPPPSHYYPPPQAYGPPPAPSCYSHSAASRAIPYINAAAYQTCPCPIQSCPKNGLTGPLTGDSKRSNLISKDSMPLPPVALALPLEPASATGPPSPARGSAGMPPPPSPAGATYQPPPILPPKKEVNHYVPPEEECDKTLNEQKKRKARVGKAMVRNNIAASMQQNTMLLMCNPAQSVEENQKQQTEPQVKREIESPKENEEIVEKKDESCEEETKQSTNLPPSPVPAQPVVEDEIPTATELKAEEDIQVEKEHSCDETATVADEPQLPPVVSTVAENVKVKNMKRKLSSSKERVPEPETSPSAKKKQKIGSYKCLIKKDTNVVKIHNGKRKLIHESSSNPVQTRRTKEKVDKMANKRKLSTNKESSNKKVKLTKPLTMNNFHDVSKQQKPEGDALKKTTVISKKSTQVNSKVSPPASDNLTAKNNVDRTIESVISVVRTPKEVSVTKKCLNKKNSIVPAAKTATEQQPKMKIECKKVGSNRRKSKCKEVVALQPAVNKIPRKSLQTPRFSHKWSWEGEPYEAKVFVNSDELTVVRRCYPAMRHSEGDKIVPRDCVLLKAGPRKNDLPFVAKIAALWENPEDGEMMMSLLWYYRPEHTEQGRSDTDPPDEVFASRHKDSNSVACIDDKCYVLTFNEYCRYRKRYKRLEEGIEEMLPCIPNPEPYPRSQRQPPPTIISPELVFFCRRVYDFRQKRIMKNPT